jgi:NADP-dependent 3-hydroxy acid dehydrogenase YdfG
MGENIMKNVILTGASDGLGKEFALRCLKEKDINIIALCRTKPDYECDFIKTDLSKEDSIINACEEIKAKYSKFDALINCAGVISLQKVNSITYDELSNVMAVNSIAPMFLASQLMNLIKENGADIINVGSTCGTKAGYEDQLAYTTSKWAIRGTSYNLQVELKKFNSRVIHINVGGMNTRFHTKYTGKELESPEEWMNPKDIAEIMLYILNLPKNIEVSEITINRKNIKK